jgi:hypothetical protein
MPHSVTKSPTMTNKLETLGLFSCESIHVGDKYGIHPDPDRYKFFAHALMFNVLDDSSRISQSNQRKTVLSQFSETGKIERLYLQHVYLAKSWR